MLDLFMSYAAYCQSLGHPFGFLAMCGLFVFPVFSLATVALVAEYRPRHVRRVRSSMNSGRVTAAMIRGR